MWITSIAVQLLWHSFYATKATEIYGRDGLLDVDDTVRSLQCLRIASTSEHCLQVYTQIVRYALYLGLAACWWNPKMGRKPIKARNKLLGLFEYYRLQLVYLAFRTAAWRAVSVGFRDVKSTQAINALALVVIVSLSIISWRMVAWDSQPKINWTITDEPLVESKSITSENDDRPFRPLPSSNPPNHLIQPRQHPVHLNINDFGRRVEPKQHVQQVPTPPNEEEDDPDSMDWAPSQSHVFSPMKDFRSSRQSSRSTMPVSTERSPFYGTLPANPRSQAAKLRNPRPVERPIEITPGPRDNLFGKGKETDDDSVMSISTTTSPAKFAPQRFFAAGDDAETGLESMFSNAFRMKEEHAPEEQSKETEQSNTFDLQPERKSSQDLSYKVWAKLFRLMSLLLICILWINAEAAAPSFGYIRGVCLIVAAVVIASRIGTSGSLVSQFGLGVETLILVYIGSSFIYPNIQLSWYLPTQTDDLGFWFLFSLLGQEIWISFFMAAPSSVGELTEQGHQAASPPRHPWHYEKEVEPSPPPSPLPNQFGSPGLGGPPPVPSHHSTSGHTNLRPQLGFASPTPSFFAFGNTHKSITPHLSQPTPRWEGNYRLRPDVQPPFGPSRSGYSVSNDVVAPRRSTRTQGGKTHSLGGAGGLGGLSLGD